MNLALIDLILKNILSVLLIPVVFMITAVVIYMVVLYAILLSYLIFHKVKESVFKLNGTLKKKYIEVPERSYKIIN